MEKACFKSKNQKGGRMYGMKGLWVEHASIWSPTSEFRVSDFSLVIVSLYKRQVPVNQFNQSTDTWGLTSFREHREITRIINTVTVYGIHEWRCTWWKGRWREPAQTTGSLSSQAPVSHPGLRHSSRGNASVMPSAHSSAARTAGLHRPRRGWARWNRLSYPWGSKASSVSLRPEEWKENSDTANQDQKGNEVYHRLWKK